jgi:hypothetical protein
VWKSVGRQPLGKQELESNVKLCISEVDGGDVNSVTIESIDDIVLMVLYLRILLTWRLVLTSRIF